ncbi:MAG TPA: response regulator [Thermomicrobiales bacterium]|jgi:DNA-binding response OmpR family regulator|nr:response regulator [Thermomicrobiales bacterium]
MRILLAEDEAHVQLALRRALEAWGYEVEARSTAADTIAALAERPADVLVLDVNLPDATGWDVLRAMQARGDRRTAVIVVSALPPRSERIREFQPYAVLHKPFPIESLRRLVRNAEAGIPASVPGTEAD